MVIIRSYITLFLIFCLSMLLCSTAFAAGKKALVLAAFGSTEPNALKSITSFAEILRKERPDINKIVTAFTAREIVEKLKDGDHETPSVFSAISALADEGYTDIGVLSLHITPGQSYANLAKIVTRLEGALGDRVTVRLSPPLVASDQDAFTLASYLIYSLPGEIKPGEAVIFAGMGSESAGSLVYPALNWALFLQGEKGSLHMVVNLENRESVTQAMQILKLNRRNVVWLIPLAGVHGVRSADKIFSTDDDSLASRLKDAGHTVRPYKQGLLANPSVQSMWKSRLKRLMPPPATE